MNNSIGVIAALVTVGCWTMGTIYFTIASNRASPVSVNRVRLLYAFILITLLSVLFFRFSLADLFLQPDKAQWFWLGISGIIGLTIGDFFVFSAFKLIGGSKASLFNAIAPVAALLLGMVLLNEHLNGMGILGMAISVSGILWFIREHNRKQQLHLELTKADLLKGVAFAALGAISQGLGLVCAKKGLVHHGQFSLHPIHATWIRMGIGTLVTYLIGFFRSNMWTEFKEITFTRSIFKPVITGTVFGPVIGVTMSMLAASVLEVSLAQTIFSLLPISVMFTARFMGKEKLSAVSLIAALISILGVVILVWRNEIHW
ncbi:MAG: DMT family transporter [Bacteroidia bacterium]|jgi:drug/metabolite transporter (DMT)-like permease